MSFSIKVSFFEIKINFLEYKDLLVFSVKSYDNKEILWKMDLYMVISDSNEMAPLIKVV